MGALAEFSKLARTWKHFYKTKEVTYIAVLYASSWYLLYSRTLFHIDEPIDIPPFQIQTPSIRAGQIRAKITEDTASEIMEHALANPGRVDVDQWIIGLLDQGSTIDHFDRLYPARAPGQLRLPTYVKESGAVDLRDVKDALSLELLACDTPFESLEELCSQLAVPIAPGELTQMTHIEIILGNLFRFDGKSSLQDGRINLIIAEPSLIEREKLKVSVKAFFAANSPPRRFVISSNNFNTRARFGRVESFWIPKAALI